MCGHMTTFQVRDWLKVTRSAINVYIYIYKHNNLVSALAMRAVTEMLVRQQSQVSVYTCTVRNTPTSTHPLIQPTQSRTAAISTGLMLNDHSNPYIQSTTVLSDNTCMMMRTYILRGSYVCWRRACGRLRHCHCSGSRLFHCLLYWLLVRDGEVGTGSGDGEVGRGSGDGEVGRGRGGG